MAQAAPCDKSVKTESKISSWCRTQISNKGKNILSEEQIAKLESLPGWGWNLNPEDWEENLNALKEFVAEHKRLPRMSSSPKEWDEKCEYLQKFVNENKRLPETVVLFRGDVKQKIGRSRRHS